LRAQAEKFIENAYPEARRWASEETDLDKSVFPEVCEWNTEEVLGFQIGLKEPVISPVTS